MKCIKNKVNAELKAGNIGSNTSCEYNPCHYRGQNCSFCYCPFYPCNDKDLGNELHSENTSNDVWDCSQCLFCHDNNVVEYSYKRFSELGITDSDDERIRDIVFKEAKERFYHLGKAVMIVGATSDAGKSITAAALCRIINRKGYSVTPFKSQNMSLNSRVTRRGDEISMIQTLQAKAAGVTSPSYTINPILLKPKGERRSQIIVEGKPFRDCSVSSYYRTFVEEEGRDIVKRNIDFLRSRYDYIVMEGAGSPAEINIYDRDIANMSAAEMADATCILVVNMEWGGSFAYALGTIELIPEKDRKRIKGIILNNHKGNVKALDGAKKRLEELTGIPVLGVIPHLNVDLPKEDSEYFRNTKEAGNGKYIISVIKLPHISNFTDLDPLMLEDVKVRFVTSSDELKGSDAIIIPGTKNTTDDLHWMNVSGLSEHIRNYVGRIPIIGICGGYQMMGRKLMDPNGIEDERYRSISGLGLFDMEVRWNSYTKHVCKNTGHMLIGDEGRISGYEIHMGNTVNNNEEPLFFLDRLRGGLTEGSVNQDRKLFGTYQHGVFEMPAFRDHIMKLIGAKDTKRLDYNAYVEENLDKLANGFEKALDMDKLWELIG